MAAARPKPAKSPAKKAAKPAPKKAAPRTKGTPDRPPAPRKVTAPARPAPTKAPARAPAPHARAPGPSSTTAHAPTTEPIWEVAQPVWQEVPAPPAPRAAAPRPFHPVTGDWLPVGPAPPEPILVDPAAYRRGSTRTILLNVVLGIVFGLLVLNLLFGLVEGGILIFAPDSDAAQEIRDQAAFIDSPAELALLTLLTFLLVGVIPFFWVVGTRVVPWLGARKYLQLWAGWRHLLRGLVLVPLMLVAVVVLSVLYIGFTEGFGALGEAPEDEAEENPAIDAITSNLTWGVAAIIALCAGIGEEILFRGILQKRLGVWGQAVLFGLAHAGGGFPPQILFAFGLGVVFGHLLKRGWSLVSLIVAHVLYDFVILSLALLYPELG